MSRTLLAVPTYDGKLDYRLERAIQDARDRNKSLDVRVQGGFSLLPYGFNYLWCEALNNKLYDWFVMVHADIAPRRENWLSHLIRTAENVGADVLSAVSPLKNDEGTTSTALERGNTEGLPGGANVAGGVGNGEYRRLTLHEIRQLPPCFNRKHAAELLGWDAGDCTLLANTGLMAVRMKRRDVLEKMCFYFRDTIRQNAQGLFEPFTQPEDWNWTRDAARNGLAVWATSEVELGHIGSKEYPSWGDWGTKQEDTSK